MQTKQVIEMFLSGRRSYCSPQTVAWYSYMLDQLGAWCGERAIEQIQEDDLYRFVTAFRQRERGDFRKGSLSNTTVAGMVRAVRSFFAWSTRQGFSDANPSADLKAPRVSRVPHSLTSSQVSKIKRELSSSDLPMAQRDRALIALMLGTGLRAAEVLALTIESVNLRDGICRVVGKGSKVRFVGLKDSCKTALRNYVGARTSGYVFLSVSGKPMSRTCLRELFDRLGERVGFHLHPHLLRHTFGTLMALNGCDPSHIQVIMGHADPSTTNVYIETARQQAALKAQMKYAP